MARKPAIPLITDFNNIPEEALVPEAEQPFAVPDHWKWVRLGAACTFEGGGTPSKSEPSYWNGPIPWASVKDLKGNVIDTTIDTITELGAANSSTRICEPLDILIATRITPGKSSIAATKIAINQDLKIIKTSVFNSDFLQKFLSICEQWFLDRASGSTVLGISVKTLSSLPVALPPEVEQKTIILLLIQRLESIDRAIAAAGSVLSNYEEQVKSLIQAGVSGELTADWREEHERSRDDWTQTTLGKAFKWSSGGTPSRKHAEYYNGTIPWVKSGELPNGVITETSEHITEEAIKNSSAKVFPAGSVLIAMYGATIGQVGILSMDAATNQAIAAARTSPHTLNEYLFYFLQASKEEFIALGKGGAQPNISQTVIKSFPYTIPPLDEQKLIIERLKINLQNYQEAMSKIEEALKLLEHTKKNLVMAALSGKLV